MIAAALVCEAAFFMSCSSKDSEKNIADKVIGKWINVEHDGKAMPTNMKGVITIETFSKGYYSTSFGGDAWIERVPFEITIRRDTLNWVIPSGPTLIYVEHVVNSVTESELNTTSHIVTKVGDKVVNEKGPMSVRHLKLPHDYRQDIVGLWEGKITSDSSKFDDGELHRWKFTADGKFIYYNLVKDKWEPVGDTLSQYFVDGTLLCSRWKNVGEEQENREWWEIESIENGVMKWKALRIGDDGASFSASFSMTRVTEP